MNLDSGTGLGGSLSPGAPIQEVTATNHAPAQSPAPVCEETKASAESHPSVQDPSVKTKVAYNDHLFWPPLLLSLPI